MSKRSYVEVGAPTDRIDREPASGQDIADAADVFGLLSDPGRLRLLAILRGGEASVGELAERAGLSESATSHALRLLRAHRVVQVRREGRMAYYCLADAHVQVLIDVALEHAAHTSLLHLEESR
jgi:ArsR family transcriptional regulator, lead/cadmium/zinc/bismuth-responsive transcriptional repressor